MVPQSQDNPSRIGSYSKKNANDSVCAVIPVYNEARFIEQVISRTLPFVQHLIIVDDGSLDGTAKLIPRSGVITVITHAKNEGKGFALNAGFRKACELGFSITVTLDGDLQHEPERIPELCESIQRCDIIIGSRRREPGVMPIHRRISNSLTSFLLSLKTHRKIEDSQSGFRAYRTAVLSEILPESKGFEAESEILIRAARKNLKIGAVSIPTIYGDEKSKMKNIEAIFGFLKVLLFTRKRN